MSVPDTVRHQANKVVFEDYPVSGFNYRLTDMQAAVGRRQLERLPAIVWRRRALAAAYTEILADVRGVRTPCEPDWARSNWQSYYVGLPEWADQRKVMQAMLDRGVATRRGIMCSHLEAPYADTRLPPLPQSERAHRHGILLPLYPQMTAETQREVVEALQDALSPAASLAVGTA
jgi:dTDP-4-amino-4,6-dideoxygalactose transaminase